MLLSLTCLYITQMTACQSISTTQKTVNDKITGLFSHNEKLPEIDPKGIVGPGRWRCWGARCPASIPAPGPGGGRGRGQQQKNQRQSWVRAFFQQVPDTNNEKAGWRI